MKSVSGRSFYAANINSESSKYANMKSYIGIEQFNSHSVSMFLDCTDLLWFVRHLLVSMWVRAEQDAPDEGICIVKNVT